MVHPETAVASTALIVGQGTVRTVDRQRVVVRTAQQRLAPGTRRGQIIGPSKWDTAEGRHKVRRGVGGEEAGLRLRAGGEDETQQGQHGRQGCLQVGFELYFHDLVGFFGFCSIWLGDFYYI